jgi:pyruvate,orthophosphate dikinase
MDDAQVYFIGSPVHQAVAPPALVGAKAHGLMRMQAIGLRVPPAFVLGTAWCERTLAESKLPAGLLRELPKAVAGLERLAGRYLGDPRRPLLVSVRSGAAHSMPGMMKTVLNVGLSDTTLPGLLRLTGNPRLAWDSYRRLVAAFGELVAGIAPESLSEYARPGAQAAEPALDFASLRAATQRLLSLYRERAREPFPQDPREQLERAVLSVFNSWNSPQAQRFRETNGLPQWPGTAVTVQAAVFGNASRLSGAGVGFTRDPISGAPDPTIDFRFNAQGEDVVSGRALADGAGDLADVLPAAWRELHDAAKRLEREFGDMQDIEFTIEDGDLYFLQTRAGGRTPLAAARIAADLCELGIIERAAALSRIDALAPSSLRRTVLEAADGAAPERLARALAASAGVATGEIALDEARVRARRAAGASVIYVRQTADTGDLAALQLAAGLLTRTGARTAHAAVVARQLGMTCLVGCTSLCIDFERRRVRFDARELAEGDLISLDGNEECVYAGAVRTRVDEPRALLDRIARLRAGA